MQTARTYGERSVGLLFMLVWVGTAVLLAFSGVPSWAEWCAVIFQWSFVVLLYSVLGFVIAFQRGPVPEAMLELDARVRSQPPQPARGLVDRYGGRAFLIVVIGALLFAGRPVLAGLYILLPFVVSIYHVRHRCWIDGVDRPEVRARDWAIYAASRSAVRVLGWCFWTLPWTAVALCLLLAGIRIKPSLRTFLGIPRGLAYLLYANPYRSIWKEVLPLGSWFVIAALSLGLSFQVFMAAAADGMAASLWGAALALLTLTLVSFALVGFTEEDGHLAQKPPQVAWPRKANPYLLALLRLVCLAALCVAGEWLLATVLLLVVCIMSGIRWFPHGDTLESEKTLKGLVILGPAIVGTYLGLTPILVLIAPIYGPYLAYQRWSDRRTARELRETFGRPDGLVYFVFSEPHQRKHFLDAEGLLGRLGERVVVRDWREDICPVRDGPSESDFLFSPEGRLLRRFEIARLREHLPFVVLVGPGNRLKPFHLSEAYRARRRDGGGALKEIEGQIRVALAKAFGAPA